jgi:hypothetical protein
VFDTSESNVFAHFSAAEGGFSEQEVCITVEIYQQKNACFNIDQHGKG